MVIVEADGGSRGNPGPAGYGAVVRDAGDRRGAGRAVRVARRRHQQRRRVLRPDRRAGGRRRAGRQPRSTSGWTPSWSSSRCPAAGRSSTRVCARSPPRRPALVRRFDAVRFELDPARAQPARRRAGQPGDGRAAGDAATAGAAGRARSPPPTAARAEPGCRVRLGATARRPRPAGSWAPRPTDRHPADPGPPRRDRADRAAPLLRPRRRAAVRRGAGPGAGRRRAGSPRSPATSRRWSAHRCPGVPAPPRRSPPRSAAVPVTRRRRPDRVRLRRVGGADLRRGAGALAGGDGRAGSPRPRSRRRAASRSSRSPTRVRRALAAAAWRRTRRRRWWWSPTSRRSS